MTNICKGCGQDGVQEPYFYCYNCNMARKTAKLTQPVAQKPAYSAPAQQGEDKTRIRGFALSYTKDLVASGNVPIQLMFYVASKMEQFLNTGKAEEYIPEPPIEDLS